MGTNEHVLGIPPQKGVGIIDDSWPPLASHVDKAKHPYEADNLPEEFYLASVLLLRDVQAKYGDGHPLITELARRYARTIKSE